MGFETYHKYLNECCNVPVIPKSEGNRDRIFLYYRNKSSDVNICMYVCMYVYIIFTESCENKSVLLILFIFYFKYKSQISNLSLANKNIKWVEIL